MVEQRQDDQLELIYDSSVPIQDVALKTYWEQWTIEMGDVRVLGRTMLVAWHDDDDRVTTSSLFILFIFASLFADYIY